MRCLLDVESAAWTLPLTKEGNEHKPGSCLVEFSPPSGWPPLRFRRLWIKLAGVDITYYLTVDGGVDRWCRLASRRLIRECRRVSPRAPVVNRPGGQLQCWKHRTRRMLGIKPASDSSELLTIFALPGRALLASSCSLEVARSRSPCCERMRATPRAASAPVRARHGFADARLRLPHRGERYQRKPTSFGAELMRMKTRASQAPFYANSPLASLKRCRTLRDVASSCWLLCRLLYALRPVTLNVRAYISLHAQGLFDAS